MDGSLNEIPTLYGHFKIRHVINLSLLSVRNVDRALPRLGHCLDDPFV
jgi:hypothetical protein